MRTRPSPPFGPARSILAALAAVSAAALSARSAPPEATRGDSAALVRQLGDPQFAVRERATQQLIQIGGPALRALEAGAQDPDREIRYRSRRILAIVRDRDLQRRLAQFAADADGSRDYNLPGWDSYRKLSGEGREARRLFVEMLRAEPELLQAFQDDPQSAADVLQRRALQLSESVSLLNRELPLGAILALLFVAGDEQVSVREAAGQALFGFCYQQSFRDAIAAPSTKDIVRAILGRWIRRGRGWGAYQAMMLAGQYQLKEGLTPAKSVVRNRAVSPQIRQFAVLTIAKLGGEAESSTLQSLLDDRTLCAMQRVGDVRYLTQIRDVALAALVYVSHRDLKDFGFTRFRPHPSYLIVPESLGFATEQERAKVFAKWRTEKSSSKARGADSPSG